MAGNINLASPLPTPPQVQLQQPLQYLFVGQGGWPPIRVQHRLVSKRRVEEKTSDLFSNQHFLSQHVNDLHCNSSGGIRSGEFIVSLDQVIFALGHVGEINV